MKSKLEILKTIKLFVSDIFCSESKTFFFNLFRFGLVFKNKTNGREENLFVFVKAEDWRGRLEVVTCAITVTV